MLKCAASLWSADMANFAAEMRRIEPYADRWHIDVADGQMVKTLLFFPDLVKALRPHTRLPFEVHLITLHPEDWLEPFVSAGADSIIFYIDTVADPAAFIRAVKDLGKQVGISLRIEEPLELLEPYLAQMDIVTIIGTQIGIKGASMDPSIPGKIARLRQTVRERGLALEIEADGGIRRETVPLLARAGADLIVPGSLIFSSDPEELHQLLLSL